MDIENEILQQRWAMMTNPCAMPVPPMCKATEEEIQQHLLWLDVLPTETGRQLSRVEMMECRERFKRFCVT